MRVIKGRRYLEENDKVRVKKLNHLSVLIRGQTGVVVTVHINPHCTVKLDVTGREYLLKLDELEVYHDGRWIQ